MEGEVGAEWDPGCPVRENEGLVNLNLSVDVRWMRAKSVLTYAFETPI